VHEQTVIHLEAGKAAAGPPVEAVVRTLETAGIRFLEVGGGVGVAEKAPQRLFAGRLALGQNEAEGCAPVNRADDAQFAALALHQISAEEQAKPTSPLPSSASRRHPAVEFE
jgi:hypothetical protein